MFDPNDLLRPHLKQLVPYSSARDDYKGKEGVFLDANENPIGSITDENWNRYPDPYQQELKAKLADVKGVNAEQIFLGNGSDEPIDLLIRAFCEPGVDEMIINPPT
ncbi:MAG: aminotransferase class I/II-fold pyridoxal phosphate-dependent enzyme, partial [Cytophagia bacterium]|nr:aminotransferase class I/II-fold pyridoxal phosphate-dependent enzyme [Cytophagia bacterium]